MKELSILPCANGSYPQLKAVYDTNDKTITLFWLGMALGYILLGNIKENT